MRASIKLSFTRATGLRSKLVSINIWEDGEMANCFSVTFTEQKRGLLDNTPSTETLGWFNSIRAWGQMKVSFRLFFPHDFAAWPAFALWAFKRNTAWRADEDFEALSLRRDVDLSRKESRKGINRVDSPPHTEFSSVNSDFCWFSWFLPPGKKRGEKSEFTQVITVHKLFVFMLNISYNVRIVGGKAREHLTEPFLALLGRSINKFCLFPYLFAPRIPHPRDKLFAFLWLAVASPFSPDWFFIFPFFPLAADTTTCRGT